MVKSRTHTLNAVFAALSDPTRRTILEGLSEKRRSVTELADPHEMSLPAISKHLRVLQEAGLIVRSKEGRFRHCALNSTPLRDASEWLDQYRRFWESRFDRLDDFLVNSKKKQP